MREYLQPTEFLDFDNPAVRDFAEKNTVGAIAGIEKAVKLYYAVRDGFQYNPYILDLRKAGLQASNLLTRNRGYCVEKAVLLSASARAVGIPSRLSFYIVKNHIATGKLEEILKSNELVFHGASEMFLEGNWVKATPAFNQNLCKYLGVEPLEFNGKTDSIFQEFDKKGNEFMKYIHDYGAFADLPYNLYLQELREHYPHIFENEKYTNGDLVYDFTKIQ
jgi:transglutaminase-like putative cysteine protease